MDSDAPEVTDIDQLVQGDVPSSAILPVLPVHLETLKESLVPAVSKWYEAKY